MSEALIQRQRDLVEMIEDQIGGVERLEGIGQDQAATLLTASRLRLIKAKEQLALLESK